jgi:release factor glutamine methyltransferase
MFHRGSMMSDIDAPVDAIVSNPPYVTGAAYMTLQPEVRVYEPETALVGGDDGLDAVRELVQVAADRLKPAGRLLMEIGYDQADAVSRIVADTERLVLLRIRPDLQGTLRAVVAERRR